MKYIKIAILALILGINSNIEMQAMKQQQEDLALRKNISWQSLLRDAVLEGSVDKIQKLLNIDPNAIDHIKNLPFYKDIILLFALREAIFESSVEKVEELLRDGANPNAVFYYQPALFSVLWSKDFDEDLVAQRMAKLLLDYGANPYLKATNGAFEGKNAFELVANERYRFYAGGNRKAKELLDKYRHKQPETLQSSSINVLAKAIKEGSLSLDEIKKQYPPEIMAPEFYEKLEALIQPNENNNVNSINKILKNLQI